MMEDKIKIDQLIDLFKKIEIKSTNSFSLTDGNIELSVNFELTPCDFIRYAEQDLNDNDDRAIVNAISNAKRAIDCRTDMILKALNISSSLIKKSKFDVLQEFGIVASRIIKKIRKVKNLMEHEYILPKIEVAEDAVDIAMLFEASANRVFHLFPEVIYITNLDVLPGKAGHLFNNYIEFFFKNDGYYIYGIKDLKEIHEEIFVSDDSPLHYQITKIYVTTHLERNNDIALLDFFKYLNYVNNES